MHYIGIVLGLWGILYSSAIASPSCGGVYSESFLKPPAKALLLKQKLKYSSRYLVVSGNTHIGRAVDHRRWYVGERERPEYFSNLDLFIQITDSKSISRNHAGILRNRDGSFSIADLNSANGTLLNGENLSKKPERLKVGDEIEIATFKAEVVRELDPDSNHHAILIGDPGSRLRGVENDLNKMSDQLARRGFHGNIVKHYGRNRNFPLSKQTLLAQLEQMSALAGSDSYFIFYFSGHGGKGGIHIGGQTITPYELFSVLKNIRGKKAVILDSCHAAAFLEEKLPPDTLVLAASSLTGYAWEGPNNHLAGGKKMGNFTAALLEEMGKTRERMDLKALGEKLEKEFKDGKFKVKVKLQEPEVEGGSFALLTVNTVDFSPENPPAGQSDINEFR